MRRAVVLLALALASCETAPDGSSRPSSVIGGGLSSFERAFNAGREAQKQSPPKPMAAPVFNDASTPVTALPPAHNATFTGRATQVQTITGGMAWQCQYNYGSQTFFILSDTYCPPTAAVR